MENEGYEDEWPRTLEASSGRRLDRVDEVHWTNRSRVVQHHYEDIPTLLMGMKKPVDMLQRNMTLPLYRTYGDQRNMSAARSSDRVLSNREKSALVEEAGAGRRRRKKDCKHCKLKEPILALPEGRLPSLCGPPASLKSDVEARLAHEDAALITPPKSRGGMKVNSIYSHDHWHAKDPPIFVTEVKEQSPFQRAYSLPVRAHTPSSQNRVNLRRSVRGEPPPHPARLQKNRHGWTLHLAHPLDGSGCTRSIVLLLIVILALLGIGGIALYIVFEPEKLQIIQQYLRSSARNASMSGNSTSGGPVLLLDRLNSSSETLLPIDATTPMETLLNVNLVFAQTSLAPEAEIQTIAATTIVPELNLNATRYCDDCVDGEVCVALVDEHVPTCRQGLDSRDPTGCAGLCTINKQKCHRLDFNAFRCTNVGHNCLDDEWTCSNTLCIPLAKRCDGHMNCYDHSDEFNCNCDLQTHFQCGNKTSCLSIEKKCDGKIDCWDATDELNCTPACPSSDQYTCRDGQCIMLTHFCDGLQDCQDGSDEPQGCRGKCNKQEYTCQNGRCIEKASKCNGVDDCGDGSDELHCRD